MLAAQIMRTCLFISRLVAILVVILCNIAPALANTPVLTLTDTANQPLSLTPYLEVLEDTSAQLSIDDFIAPNHAQQFLAQQSKAEALSYGFTRSAYWLKLTILNTSSTPQIRMLEVANYALSYVDFYYPDLNNSGAGYSSFKTGAAMPFSSRAIKNRFYVFPVNVPARSQQVIFLRVQALDGLLIPAKLWTTDGFQEHTRQDYVTQSVYYGMVLAMVLFNLLLFVVLKDKLYLIYVCFIACFATALASFNGLMHEFVWQQASSWSNIAHFVGWSSTFLCTATFIYLLLYELIKTSLWSSIFKIIAAILIVAIVGMLVKPTLFVLFSVAMNGITSIVFYIVFIFGVIYRYRPAYFLVVSFSMLGFGGLMIVLRGLGALPTNFLTVNGLQIGSALEMITLSLALADRFNQIRKEKATDQLLLLQAEQALVKNLQNREEELQSRVQERTSELQAANDETLRAFHRAETLRQMADEQRQLAETAQIEIAHTLHQLQTTQTQLIASEKMASLGLLVSNVAHEINSPIGAIHSSNTTIADSMLATLRNMPRLMDSISREHRTLFFQLISHQGNADAPLSTREERQRIKQIATFLENAGVEGATRKARLIVKLRAEQHAPNYIPLLVNPDCDLILNVAAGVADVLSGTGNIATAANKVSRIVSSLKQLNGNDRISSRFENQLYLSIEKAIAVLDPRLQEIDVVRNYQDVAPLKCDPDALQEVWTHIISNALYASDHKGVILIGLCVMDNTLEVRIADFGCGIDTEIQCRVFEPFFTTRQSGEGGGMGLTLAKKVVEEHKGTIEITSTVGVGTTITVSFPYSS